MWYGVVDSFGTQVQLQACKMSLFSCGVLLVVLLCCSRLVYRQYYGQQNCEMTYMWQWPRYQEVPLPPEVEAQYVQYSLHYYYESKRPLTTLGPLKGVPVLFLPGNAGSYKQARSSASIALRMHLSDFTDKKHFDFFTIDFNEELSGMFGGVLQAQTDYVVECIRHILSLYKNVKPCPQSVVIIGHSMGGVLARGIFAHPSFNHSTVTTIIALSSPLLRPVLTFDLLSQQYYDRIEEVWSHPSVEMSDVTLVSISGGERDVMVPTFLTRIPHNTTIHLATPAIPRNWASADHLAVVWCRRVQLAITRALFFLQDGGRGLSQNSTHRSHLFRHFLLHGKELPIPDSSLRQTKTRNIAFVKELEFSQQGSVKEHKRVALPSPPAGVAVLIASNSPQDSWLSVCSLSPADSGPLTCAVVKVKTLDSTELESLLPGATHLLVTSPTTAQGFMQVQTCSPPSTILPLPWLRTAVRIATGHCCLMNFSFPHLTQMWQAYSASVSSSCGGVSGGLVVPWYPHSSLANTTQSPLTIPLSLLAPPPPHHATPPHLLLWSSSACELEVVVTFDPLTLLDKLAVVHAPLLLPWVTVLCITAHSRWLSVELVLLTLVPWLSSSGLLPASDWTELSAVWSGCGPVLLHLLAYGLQQLLCGAVGLVARACHTCRCWGRGFSWLLLVTSVLPILFCSAGSLLLASSALLLQASRYGKLRDVMCVLVCLQLLTLPALFTWIRVIRFSLWLSPDPHVTIATTTSILTSFLLYSTPPYQSTGPVSSPKPPPLLGSLMRSLLMLILLGTCLTHAYRMTHVIGLYLVVTTLGVNL